MVRVKHRYLLVQILTPSAPSKPAIRRSTDLQDSKHASPLILHIHSPTSDALTAPLLLSHIRHNLSDLFGDHGAALANTSLVIKYWSPATSTFIVRCKRECLHSVWAAITWCTSVPMPALAPASSGLGTEPGRGGARGNRRGGISEKTGFGRGKAPEKEIVMRVVRVSGTIRKCEEEAIRRARALCGKVMGVKVAMEAGASFGNTRGVDVDATIGDPTVDLYAEVEAVQSELELSEQVLTIDEQEDDDDDDDEE